MWDGFMANAGRRLSRPRNPTSRTRPTGWKATGPASSRGEDDETKPEETTGVAIETLREVGAAFSRKVPGGFDVNPKIARQLEAKQAAIETGEGIDWATGEALAFGTLLLEGTASACRARIASAARSASATRC